VSALRTQTSQLLCNVPKQNVLKNVITPARHLWPVCRGVCTTSCNAYSQISRLLYVQCNNVTTLQNVITPGTPFMARLSRCLHYFVQQKYATDAAWRGVKVIFSDARVPGRFNHVRRACQSLFIPSMFSLFLIVPDRFNHACRFCPFFPHSFFLPSRRSRVRWVQSRMSRLSSITRICFS
jgi:hypothetical protein